VWSVYINLQLDLSVLSLPHLIFFLPEASQVLAIAVVLNTTITKFENFVFPLAAQPKHSLSECAYMCACNICIHAHMYVWTGFN